MFILGSLFSHYIVSPLAMNFFIGFSDVADVVAGSKAVTDAGDFLIQFDGKLDQVLDYIRWSIKSKRIFIKPPLQDYDRTKSNLVTREQFIRVLDNLGLVKNE